MWKLDETTASNIGRYATGKAIQDEDVGAKSCYSGEIQCKMREGPVFQHMPYNSRHSAVPQFRSAPQPSPNHEANLVCRAAV